IEAVRAKYGDGSDHQPGLFDQPGMKPPLRDAVEFYKHPHGWTNRLVAGDSLLVMNSLLEKEGMAGKVQMVYLDPPYGIKYGSNFQPFVNKRDVKDRKDDDLTRGPEMLKAFRDTWELGIHSYLTYLRDRLWLAKELLHESGSCFVQISDENVHRVRAVMDEVFGPENFCSEIVFRKTTGKGSQLLDQTYDTLLWYARSKPMVKYHALYTPREPLAEVNVRFIELADGTRRRLTPEEIVGRVDLPKGGRLFRPNPLTNQRPAQGNDLRTYEFDGQEFRPGAGTFRTDRAGLDRLKVANRLMAVGTGLTFVRFVDDFAYRPHNNIWDDTRTGGFGEGKVYVVQTISKVIERCLLMTTDPGDLVLDPTCGSGTTAFVAEQWGRRWITTDTSRVAITLAKQRLMTSSFDYYEMAHPAQGVRGGFRYKTVPHVTLKSIANNPEIREGMSRQQIDDTIAKFAPPETLYDQPIPDKSKARVTGPFTVEAVPAPFAPAVASPVGETTDSPAADASISREGETLRQAEWRDELLRTGVRGRGGQMLRFVRVEPMPGARWLHAEAEIAAGKEAGELAGQRVAVSFGPEHAPLEQRQVEAAWDEAWALRPKPGVLLFCAFQFDPEAQKDIDQMDAEKAGMVFLRAEMNDDLHTDDLKKNRSSNESFWLMGQPDIRVSRVAKGEEKGKWRVAVEGFDYFNLKEGRVESGGAADIAVWMLDTDYDGRSVYPRQVFFPMAGAKEGWAKLSKSLKAEIDPELIEAYRGAESLPFEAGPNKRIAVKVVDARGIESLVVRELDGAGR
ncbi:MAG: site-specific DNA-methyltransferase, partial [Phycisphaerales bacterium JB041]